MSKIKWHKVPNQSLARAVREVGFDITVFDEYSEETQQEIMKLSINEVLRELSEAYEDATGKALKDVRKGVYVICLSKPFTIQYEKGQSEIIYIGQGNVSSRLKTHFSRSLFRFMQSLSGANFDFHIAEPKRPGIGKSKVYYKHIEFLLLDKFKQRHGGTEIKYPLLNTNAGSDKKFGLEKGSGWEKPLKASGKKPSWALEPTKHWDFAHLD